MTTPTARDQEKAFAETVRNSPEFVHWILDRTKFKGLDVELILARSDNPWYQSRRTGRQSETDILLVFQIKGTTQRFALHIENKKLADKFGPDQPQLYHERAADWANTPKWGSYMDYQCLLVAPQAFIIKYRSQAEVFHACIAHEELSRFIPEFSPVRVEIKVVT